MASDLNRAFAGFNIKASCLEAYKHKHFSFYDVKLDYGCKLSSIVNNSKEIALSLGAWSDFILKPIMKKGIVRMQTTNNKPEPLLFEKYYSESISALSGANDIPLLLGESNNGDPVWLDLSYCPHLLIAGSTGSGKSITLHTVIANLLKLSNIELFLVDPKKVEFNLYKDISNVRYVSSYNGTISLLESLIRMMEQIYQVLSGFGFSSVKEMPLYKNKVIIIDEVADLMMQQKNNEFENLLIRLAQKSRAAGIHIILATQRPSVDVITGLIKANFPSRLACKVASKVDSRVILDCNGAENLIGKGDSILISPDHDMVRFQGIFTKPPSKE
jgi:S-DNA-T family DNA segregation ATPase FtsK/SpoIIIE